MNPIKILITGDFCLQHRAFGIIKNNRVNQLVDLDLFKDHDLKVVNFEAPIANNEKALIKTGPSLKNPDDSIVILKKLGFNLICLANNHIMDYGPAALSGTIEKIKETDVSFIGAGSNQSEASKPFIFEKNGYRIGILNMAENEFGNASIQDPGFNAYDAIGAYNQIKSLKIEVDDVVVIFHGGHEHYKLPSPEVQKRYRFLIDAGAKAVIAHHTHCVSGWENYRDGLIIYSLGNFIFDHPTKRDDKWNYGMVVSLILDRNGLFFELFPFEQFNHTPELRFLEGKEKENFFEDLNELNNIINNEKSLMQRWKEYLSQHKRKYLSYIEVPNSRYLRGARYFRLLPSCISKKHKAIILNLIRCDSHREIFKEAIKENIYNE